MKIRDTGELGRISEIETKLSTGEVLDADAFYRVFNTAISAKRG
jgi:hypothetical protein